MTAPTKDTIYIDIEDEITAVIDKMVSSGSKVIALVPPKRAQMLQSIVNMKLLKRSADQAGKRIVLVTSEHALLPLAGLAGVHVAKNLQSKPYLPEKPSADEIVQSSVGSVDVSEDESSIGALATASGLSPKEIPTEDVPVADDATAIATKPVKSKKSKKDKLNVSKIPNFNSFRNRLLLIGGGLTLLIVLWVVLYKVLPRASIQIKAETSRLDISSSFSADTTAKSDDLDKPVLMAEEKQVQKAYTETFTPTGEKNNGDKATGTMTITNCDSNDSVALPAGTAFTAGNFVFRSSAAATIPGGDFGGGKCKSGGQATINVTADQAGDSYNLSARAYSVGGVSALVTGQGSQMTGGTSKITKIVSQGDIDSVKQKLAAEDSAPSKDELKKQLGDNFVIVDSSFSTENGTVSTDPAVNQEATGAKATMTATYKLLGVRKDSLKNFLESEAKKKYDASAQKIYENGLTAATMKVNKKSSDSVWLIDLRTDAYVGPNIDQTALARKVTGKRTGEAIELIKGTNGVRDVSVKLSPFYITRLPSPGRITINFDVTNAAAPTSP